MSHSMDVSSKGWTLLIVKSCALKSPAQAMDGLYPPARRHRGPHQFRTRNNLNKPEQTRSKPNKNAGKSTKLIDILPLITVWLQVRVLPGPPVKCRALYKLRAGHTLPPRFGAK
jgi:hypothetical protein